ncbi:hypothetical protein LCGC14_0815540 [marine sediment metagenome]|uniref:Uncharacterized protein n=1 Tax=marine sediment metagenome TaxID=412755 RepID=A0A0F9PQ18_9ZZZZ
MRYVKDKDKILIVSEESDTLKVGTAIKKINGVESAVRHPMIKLSAFDAVELRDLLIKMNLTEEPVTSDNNKHTELMAIESINTLPI